MSKPSGARIRVLLVEDHTIVRQGVRKLLEAEEGIEIVGEAGDGRAAVAAVDDAPPDVVVMDSALPDMNGVEATNQILRAHPTVRVLALSMHADRRYVQNMRAAGARGYVLKGASSDELTRAVETVARGGLYTSPEVTEHFVAPPPERGRSAAGAFAQLGAREREVLQLLAEGSTSPQIAAQLSISTRTVEAHRRNIMRKLDVHSVAGLTKYAVREGLTELER